MSPVLNTEYNEAYAAAWQAQKEEILSYFTGKAQQDNALGSSPLLAKLVDQAGAVLYAQLLYILAKMYINPNSRVTPSFDDFILTPDYAILKQCAACQGVNLESIVLSTGISSLFG